METTLGAQTIRSRPSCLFSGTDDPKTDAAPDKDGKKKEESPAEALGKFRVARVCLRGCRYVRRAEDGPRRRRGRDADIFLRRIAATPRPRRGSSSDASRRRRDADVPRGDASAAADVSEETRARRRRLRRPALATIHAAAAAPQPRNSPQVRHRRVPPRFEAEGKGLVEQHHQGPVPRGHGAPRQEDQRLPGPLP